MSGGLPVARRAHRDRLAAAGVALSSVAPWFVVGGALGSSLCLVLGKRSVARFGFAAVLCLQVARWWPRWRAERAASAVLASSGVGTTGPVAPTRLRLLTANLWNGAASVDGLAQELELARPDIVVLQEVTPRHLSRLDELGALRRYEAAAVAPDPGHDGLGVWSLFELTSVEWVVVAGELQLRAWVVVPGTRLRLYAVHAPAPVPSKVARWRSWFAEMAEETARAVDVHRCPVVVAGDFNATADHGPFRSLLRAGLVDVAGARRRSARMTWPARWRAVPSLVRIDHVLVSPNVQVEACFVGRGRESDHRPVIADLRTG